jgi:predicted alpha/beta-fold hydrolase
LSFTPSRWARGPHLQTIVPTFSPIGGTDPAAEVHDVEVGSGTSVRTLVTRAPAGSRGTIVLLHGLGGSAKGVYMVRTARAALARGWSAVRVNLRNCGGTEHLARTLYNAGQSDDLGRVLEVAGRIGLPRPYAAIGFSLGGNLALRYAGLAGAGSLADAFVGVNPPVDLIRCIEAIERPANRAYHLYFRAKLIAQLRAIRRVRDVPGPAATWRSIRGVRAFDDLFTAPDAGLPSAEAYYVHASAGPVLEGIRRPTLVLSAADDPFVPVTMFPAWNGASPHVRFVHPDSGGHCGYWSAGIPRFWAAEAALAFLDSPENRP